MKITLKSTFNQNETDLETQSTTLGTLLDELSSNHKLTKIEFFDSESGEVYPDCEVLVNGLSYRLLADDLDTKLKNGDKIEIIIIPLAGG